MATADKDIILSLKKIRQNDIPWNYVLNSICSKPLHIACQAFQLGIDTNLGDVRIFKGTKQLEKEVLQLIGKLLGSDQCVGNIVS